MTLRGRELAMFFMMFILEIVAPVHSNSLDFAIVPFAPIRTITFDHIHHPLRFDSSLPKLATLFSATPPYGMENLTGYKAQWPFSEKAKYTEVDV
jgi:hypothetical protein